MSFVCVDGHCSPEDPLRYLDLLAGLSESLAGITLAMLPTWSWPAGTKPAERFSGEEN